MRSLYLHENCIEKIEGLGNMPQLVQLQLSDNMISKIEGLSTLQELDTLYLARNRVGKNGLQDLYGLLECPSISTLDI